MRNSELKEKTLKTHGKSLKNEIRRPMGGGRSQFRQGPVLVKFYN